MPRWWLARGHCDEGESGRAASGSSNSAWKGRSAGVRAEQTNHRRHRPQFQPWWPSAQLPLWGSHHNQRRDSRTAAINNAARHRRSNRQYPPGGPPRYFSPTSAMSGNGRHLTIFELLDDDFDSIGAGADAMGITALCDITIGRGRPLTLISLSRTARYQFRHIEKSS